MPALPADIEAVLKPGGVSLAVASDSAVLSRFPAARDGQTQPTIGFWDSNADAQAVVTARLNLVKAGRRRVRALVDGIQLALVPSDVTPAVRLDAGEIGPAFDCLVARLVFDLEAETTELELWG